MTWKIAAAFVLGAFTWTLMEYFIHRYLGHDKRLRKNLFAKEHIRHHAEGDYFAPWWKKAAAGVSLFVIIIGPAVLLTSLWTGVAWVSGLVAFYLYYEVLHRLEHVYKGFGPYGRWARRHHFYHHFVDARFNHGVTSPIWDHVFGTHRTPEVITVPRRLMMPWLGDPERGVYPEFEGSFALKKKPA
jgi:4-hydroxysphinganine ceramide fatty acyl 2-hydroxylase